MALVKLNLAQGVTGTLPTSNYVQGGISAASQWRLTTSFTGDAEPIASNWEVNDTAGYGSLGSAMTESSGTFTFPSTGIWQIMFQCQWYYSGDSRWNQVYIKTTIAIQQLEKCISLCSKQRVAQLMQWELAKLFLM
jgi:hypothetical protein